MGRHQPARSRLVSMCCGALVLAVLLPIPLAVAQPSPPVDGVVVDRFRPPAHIGAPGNRGWEYATTPGAPISSVLGGVVVFAGPVAGNLHVSVDHPGGIRSTYSFLAEITVRHGQVVAPGHNWGWQRRCSTSGCAAMVPTSTPLSCSTRCRRGRPGSCRVPAGYPGDSRPSCAQVGRCCRSRYTRCLVRFRANRHFHPRPPTVAASAV